MLSKKNRKWYLVILISIAVGTIFGYSISQINNKNNISLQSEKRNSNYKYISPLIECITSENRTEPNLREIQDKLENEITSFTSEDPRRHVSVYMRDLKNGPWFGIKENEKFSPASLFKVPVMIAYYKAAETNPGLLKKEIPYRENNLVKQNIEPSSSLITGKKYTIDELIKKMIQKSDNNALESISAEPTVQQAEIEKMFKDIGLGNIKFDLKTALSVREYSMLFRVLYNASYLDEEHSEKALELLAESEYDNGIKKPIPNDIKVANKFGERHILNTDTYQLHDCGIIYFPNRPYLLCVMTRGENMDILAKEIQDVSKSVFESYKEEYGL